MRHYLGLALIGMVIGCTHQPHVQAPKVDPFATLVGRSLVDVTQALLTTGARPPEMTDLANGTQIYTWRWTGETVTSSTSDNPGVPVNVGTIGRPRYIYVGGNSKTKTTVTPYSYWLALTAKDGLITEYHYSLPKREVADLARRAGR